MFQSTHTTSEEATSQQTMSERFVAPVSRRALRRVTKTVTGIRAKWQGCEPEEKCRVYFGNHRSHADFVVVWSVLSKALRANTRPVAGADYWDRPGIKRFFGRTVVNAVLIDRQRTVTRTHNPIDQMVEAVEEGSSLIIFPEGTRNMTEDTLLPFKSGIFRLAQACPEVEFVPVWIDNLNRVMPKGATVPVPLICEARFGEPLTLDPDESKETFLTRARNGLLALADTDTGEVS